MFICDRATAARVGQLRRCNRTARVGLVPCSPGVMRSDGDRPTDRSHAGEVGFPWKRRCQWPPGAPARSLWPRLRTPRGQHLPAKPPSVKGHPVCTWHLACNARAAKWMNEANRRRRREFTGKAAGASGADGFVRHVKRRQSCRSERRDAWNRTAGAIPSREDGHTAGGCGARVRCAGRRAPSRPKTGSRAGGAASGPAPSGTGPRPVPATTSRQRARCAWAADRRSGASTNRTSDGSRDGALRAAG